MLSTALFLDRIGFDKGVVVGYTGIVLSFLLVFFGIRSYRENVGGGQITFGRALSVGPLITLISCAFYVITWEIVYFRLMPDFAEKYTNYMVDQLRASGASQQAIDAKMQEMKNMGLVRQPTDQCRYHFHGAVPDRINYQSNFCGDIEKA
jgi:hypothetical protein